MYVYIDICSIYIKYTYIHIYIYTHHIILVYIYIYIMIAIYTIDKDDHSQKWAKSPDFQGQITCLREESLLAEEIVGLADEQNKSKNDE